MTLLLHVYGTILTTSSMSPEVAKDYGLLELNTPSKPEVEFVPYPNLVIYTSLTN